MKERIADVQHSIWAHWMEYLFSVCQFEEDGSCVIPSEKVQMWKRQMATPYSELSLTEKKSDRQQACKVLEVLNNPDALQSFFNDTDTGFVVTAALRYCMGRMTYAPGLVIEWIKKYWEYMPEKEKAFIKKEIGEYTDSDRYKGHDCDEQTWNRFNQWLKEQTVKD